MKILERRKSVRSNITFTPEEQKRIDEAVQTELNKDREALIQAEINNRLADARNSQPGHSGY